VEQAIRGAITQLGVVTWQGKHRDAITELEVFCSGASSELLQFSAEATPVVKSCLYANKNTLLRLLRKLSERRANYTTSDMIEEFFRLATCFDKKSFSRVA